MDKKTSYTTIKIASSRENANTTVDDVKSTDTLAELDLLDVAAAGVELQKTL